MTINTDSEAWDAQRLIKSRSGHGWSQAELAEVSGVAAAQISRYEAGRSKPRTEVVAKLAKALAVSFEWLAYGQGGMDEGLDVPKYPSTQELVASYDLAKDPELREALEFMADRLGLTIEMALKTSILNAAKELAASGEKSPHARAKPKS